MVRRLVQHILRWIKRFFIQVRAPKPNPHNAPRHRLPKTTTLLSKRHQPAAEQPSHGTVPVPHPVQPAPTSLQKQPTVTASKVVNRSNFQVLLSHHQHPPSAAIQALNRQLLTDQTQAVPRTNHTKIDNVPTSATFTKMPDVQSLTSEHKTSHQDSSQTISSVLEEENTVRTAAELEISQLPTNNIQSSPQSLTKLSIEHRRNQPSIFESITYPPKTSDATDTPVTTTKSNTRTITKQGVIKLLFKLKKNNYHGYITPNDGSKDIIFHQKYVGDAIFSQLERDMAVEVIAHITEGKAYADKIRIL